MNKVGQKYKQRVIWDEYECLSDGTIRLHNQPHVERFLNTRLARLLRRHIQNFCWTIERIPVLNRPNRKSFDLHLCAPTRTLAHNERRIFLDISNTMGSSIRTGIARVCLRCCEEGVRGGLFIPVVHRDGRLIGFDDHAKPTIELKPGRGDIYVIFDIFWDHPETYLQLARNIRAAGGLVALHLYDLIPVNEPEICQLGLRAVFGSALSLLLPSVDIAIGISQTTLDDFDAALAIVGAPRPPKSFFYHLGSDLASRRDIAPDVVLPPALSDAPVVLSVGTIEPKKGYALTLDAFDDLWAAGERVKLVIVGSYGWLAQAVRQRIEKHPRLNTDLFWFPGASEALLSRLYSCATCFLQASVAEGFGLPIVEAGAHGVPILASDLPVFREIAGDALIYFRSEDATALRDRLLEVLRSPPKARPWRVPTWSDAVRDLHEGLIASATALETSATGRHAEPPRTSARET